MKCLRVLLLVLLAALLPLRGAIAGAMLCPSAGAHMQGAMQHMDHAAMGHDHTGHGGHQHHQAPSHGDKCDLCAAFCSLTPMPSCFAGLSEPPLLAEIRFPSLSAPAPSFVSDRQERPPRTS